MFLLLLISTSLARNSPEVYNLPRQTNGLESDDSVTGQYTDYPYPAFMQSQYLQEKLQHVGHSESARGRCKSVPQGPIMPSFYSSSHDLDILNHYLYQGCQDFQDFRVLVAGGGTGSAVNLMKEQLVGRNNSEVVYLDLSPSSQAVARMRAELRGLEDDISWIQGKIERIPELGLGKFHFIDCEGVLHHLKDKQLGLDLLADSLTEDGGMTVMVYARVGRTGVYQVQRLMQLVNEGVKTRVSELGNTWSLLHSMGGEDVLKRRMDFEPDKTGMDFFYRVVEEGREDEAYWDVEAYDMLCHTQDSPFSIDELHRWVEAAGLHIVAPHHLQTKLQLSLDHLEHELYLDSDLVARLREDLPLKDHWAIAELVLGSFNNHFYFLSKMPDSVARLEDEDMLVSFNGGDRAGAWVSSLRMAVNEVINHRMVVAGDFLNLATAENEVDVGKDLLKTSVTLKYIGSFWYYGKFKLQWPLTLGVIRVLELITGNKTFNEILEDLEETMGSTKTIRSEFKRFHKVTGESDLLLLNHRQAPLQDKYRIKAILVNGFQPNNDRAPRGRLAEYIR